MSRLLVPESFSYGDQPFPWNGLIDPKLFQRVQWLLLSPVLQPVHVPLLSMVTTGEAPLICWGVMNIELLAVSMPCHGSVIYWSGPELTCIGLRRIPVEATSARIVGSTIEWAGTGVCVISPCARVDANPQKHWLDVESRKVSVTVSGRRVRMKG